VFLGFFVPNTCKTFVRNTCKKKMVFYTRIRHGFLCGIRVRGLHVFRHGFCAEYVYDTVHVLGTDFVLKTL